MNYPINQTPATLHGVNCEENDSSNNIKLCGGSSTDGTGPDFSINYRWMKRCGSEGRGSGAELVLCLKLIHIFLSSTAVSERPRPNWEVCHNTRFIIWSALLM